MKSVLKSNGLPTSVYTRCNFPSLQKSIEKSVSINYLEKIQEILKSEKYIAKIRIPYPEFLKFKTNFFFLSAYIVVTYEHPLEIRIVES